MISRFSVFLNAESGLKMSSDITKMIYDDAIGLKNMRQNQVSVLAIGGNNIRKGMSLTTLLALFKYLMKRVRRIQRFHLVIASLIPTPESAAQDELFKEFDLLLEDLIKTFPCERFSFLNLKRAFRINGILCHKRLAKYLLQGRQGCINA